MTAPKRVTAGPYTLELPPNGVAILYEADESGADHRLPGGVGYLEALVQFAGEVIRLQAMVNAIDGFDYRCDCCDNGLNAEWDFCPFCGLCQREQPSGLCLAGLAVNAYSPEREQQVRELVSAARAFMEPAEFARNPVEDFMPEWLRLKAALAVFPEET